MRFLFFHASTTNWHELLLQGHDQCVNMRPSAGTIEVRNPKTLEASDPGKTFTFDAVYDWNSKQVELYEETFAPLVDSVLEGFNGTIFAYGQTGTGKTFTMEGVKNDEALAGVIPRSFSHIFSHISAAPTGEQYLVRSSYLEIYQEEVRDLLSKDQGEKNHLELKERPDTGIYVKDLSSFVCKSQCEIEHVMAVGNTNRKVGKTNMNEHSSRSHAIFIITVECSTVDEDEGDKAHIRAGKLNLVDLAGSERQAKTGATGERLKEATKINLSLSCLGNVIKALVDGKSTHVPYRDSKLTRLLQDSLGGNARTVMVANIGPADYNYEESLTTLRYANRAKDIKNKPRINEDPKDALLREFQEEIARLKTQLSGREGSGGKRRKKEKRSKSGKRMQSSVEGGSESGSEESSMSLAMSAETEELEARLSVERDLLSTDTTMLAEERERLNREVSAKEEALSRQRKEQEAVKAKIKAMESKLLTGDGRDAGNIKERTNEQHKMLEARKAEVAAKKAAAREAARQLEEREERDVELEKTYTSLQAEVDAKTKRLRKLFSKMQGTKQEIQDVTEEYNRDRRDLEETQRELMKELKLKLLLIDNFIPPAEKAKLLSRAQYDEERDAWFMATPGRTASNTIAKRPVSAAGHRRPVSEYARVLGSSLAAAASGDGAVSRFR